MENFVTQGLNIEKKRYYAKPEDGGIGIFDLKMFLIGLQSTWIKRAFQCSNDNWKFDLVCGSERDILKVGLDNPNVGSTLTSIAKNFRTFAEVFAQVESNFLHVPILNSKLFGYGNLENNIFDDKFFRGWTDIDYTNITWSSLTYRKQKPTEH